jgi:hypothetical protein
LDFDVLIADLVGLWTSARKKPIDTERVRLLIGSYFPVASKIKRHDRMEKVFDAARKHLETEII